MVTLNNQVALVTGATSGIGQAIAMALAEAGACVGLVGRQREALEQTAQRSRLNSPKVVTYQLDLGLDTTVEKLKNQVLEDFGRLDILVHSAAVLASGPVSTASVEEFDWQYRINVRAPYALTQILLPSLIENQGQIVFIISSAGLKSRANFTQFAATKHALKAVSDGLREEVNPLGVRVLSIFPGRTATPGLAELHKIEGRPYHPEYLCQPEDIAAVVCNSLSLPRTAEVTDINIRSFMKFE